MKDLYVDLDKLVNASSQMTRYASDLYGYFVRLDVAMSTLEKNDWKSEASKEFFEKYDTSWRTDMDLFLEIVNEMGDGLRYAVQQYRNIQEMNPFSTSRFN